jgi:pyruvate oxidase
MSKQRVWHKVADLDELPDGRVKSVSCGRQTLCLSHVGDQYGALDNRCPHQGGPLGEGSIEGQFLRCPWHGWDFDPLTGKPPGGFDDGVDTYPVEIRADGVYVALEEEVADADPTVSDVMVKTMVAWGVDTVFGMVGHSNLGVAEAMRLEEAAGRLRFIGIRHEGAAAFAASAYGKLTGRPAACFSIAGPGATNLLTGLWDAHVDRAPVLALTGQVPSTLRGRGAFQEVDLDKAFGQVAVWSAEVGRDSEHAELMTLACKHAILGNGVSHLTVPDDVASMVVEAVHPGGPEGRMPSRAVSPPADALAEALERLRAAKRPAFVVGHGARFGMDAVVALAEQVGAPVMTTFKAKGQISDAHPLGCGVLGRSGTPIASWFMNECDLLVVFGASFSNHTGIEKKKPIVQVDLDPLMLGRFHKVEVPVWGDVTVVAGLLHAGLGDAAEGVDQRAEVAERWALWRTEKQVRLSEKGSAIGAAAIFAALTRQAPADAIISVDVGNNTYSFGRYFEVDRQTVLMSGYLGSIGFGLPGGMGAWAATQGDDPRYAGRPVLSLSGDGGLGQYLAEFTTAVKYEMNLTHVLVNNGELGKISKEQRAGSWPVWQTALQNPAFADFATSCGGLGIRVTEEADLDAALARAIAHPGPALVEIISDASLL